jgi:hypothetical protein
VQQEKELINKELFNISEQDFEKQITNDFVGTDFIEQLEWAMLLIQSRFKQIKFAEYIPPVSANHYDRSYLMSANLDDNLKYLAPFSDFQANPKMFPNINIKSLLIGDSIQLTKIKELQLQEKRHLHPKYKHVYEISTSFYKKDTDSFYGIRHGYEINDGFFDIRTDNTTLETSKIPNPISLHPNYAVPKDSWKYLTANEIVDIMKTIAISYQIAMSMYYEWSIYLKERDNIGLIIPIEPAILSEVYKTSMLRFEDKKRMLHFVRDHYRRKRVDIHEDYSIYVNKYLRGEHKFDYRGFYAEIIPPKYDLNRVKTRKKFIDPNL